MFPRLIEERINNLLDEAEPNRMKAYQIYKTCQNENLWSNSFADFSEHLSNYFSSPKNERSKARFDSYLERPMHKSVFEIFALDFRTAVVNSRSLHMVASWAHNLIRVNFRDSQTISMDVMTRTLGLITNPTPFEKAQDIEFEDFCTAWKRTVHALFGKKYETDVNALLEEFVRLNLEQKDADRTVRFIPELYLTQTEIDWTSDVLWAAENLGGMPHYPLSRGPQKQPLIDLLKVVQLYNVVFANDLPDLVQHRNQVRATILDRCQRLLRDRAA